MIDHFDVEKFIESAIAEDIGQGDATSQAVISSAAHLSAVIAARVDMMVSGVEIAAEIFRTLSSEAKVNILIDDGQFVRAGSILMEVSGPAIGLLSAERTALNTLQHLSGIATLTRQFVDRIRHTKCVLLDTRKTTPGLRLLEKYAVTCGGGKNHRLRLDDGILIKDNHIALVGDIQQATSLAKKNANGLQVQVEVDEIAQIEPALAGGADSLLLDNFTIKALKEAVVLVNDRVSLEASGGVTLDSVKDIAETGVNFVSVGRITQSAPAADIGMDYAPLDKES